MFPYFIIYIEFGIKGRSIELVSIEVESCIKVWVGAEQEGVTYIAVSIFYVLLLISILHIKFYIKGGM